jgi:uncharacterized ferritin-like protein (DUF455 family)
VELQDFAQQILFGQSLADKLISPEKFKDECISRSPRLPSLPGRPSHLRFPDSESEDLSSSRQVFPRLHELEDPGARGAAMHFFASHELLALELMALVLLKFPEAPKAFRRGLAQTMRDEQRHLQLYLHHMKRLGVEFGSIPLGGYFWKSLSGVSSLLDFVTQMSLTFEQANLDFALFFAKRFEELGDAESAHVMSEVFEDEIRHVRHGLMWFREWKPQDGSDWDCFSERLEFPLSPSRAKGMGFSVAARQRCGLDSDFIERLRLFSQSKGRPPRIYIYNSAQEFEVGAPGLSYNQSGLLGDIAEDLEILMMHVASHDDVLALRRLPSQEFLRFMMDQGFPLPEITEYSEKDRAIRWDSRRKFTQLVPWGMSPRMSAVDRKLHESVGLEQLPAGAFDRHLKKCLSKTFSAEMRSNLTMQVLETRGSSESVKHSPAGNCDENDTNDIHASAVYVARTLDQLSVLLPRITSALGENIVLKAPYGSSGHNQLRIRGDAIRSEELSWIRKVLNVHQELVVEPRRQIEAEFSVQMTILGDGRVQEFGVVRNLAAPNGQYLGSAVGKNLWGLSREVRQYFYSVDYSALISEMGKSVAGVLGGLGYVGPFGIDTYIFRTREGNLDFNLLGEINLRHTMGRIALELRTRCNSGRSLIMALVPVSHWPEIVRAVGREVAVLPAREQGREGAKQLIDHGLMPLADEKLARRLVPALWVGREEQAEAIFRLLAQHT